VPVTLEAVQAAIPEGAALVEFASFFPLDTTQLRFGDARYVVYVTNRDGRITWANLGDAGRIDALVTKFRALVRSSTTDRAVLHAAARRLDAAVMARVRGLAGGSKRLLLSPDGALNLVPFIGERQRSTEWHGRSRDSDGARGDRARSLGDATRRALGLRHGRRGDQER
jgi:hypothetical protein